MNGHSIATNFLFGWCSQEGHYTRIRNGICMGCNNIAPNFRSHTDAENSLDIKDLKLCPKLQMKPVVVLQKLKIIRA
ncbi:unnamed protein product [Allacma fusca]|uniref:Uncharacterized protein n=1 Tax=Allacma fusca TaxID=39272 RepID=A0A8J2JBP4_9HEXA|nr:unnamed protein product [Allacma fusca]